MDNQTKYLEHPVYLHKLYLHLMVLLVVLLVHNKVYDNGKKHIDYMVLLLHQILPKLIDWNHKELKDHKTTPQSKNPYHQNHNKCKILFLVLNVVSHNLTSHSMHHSQLYKLYWIAIFHLYEDKYILFYLTSPQIQDIQSLHYHCTKSKIMKKTQMRLTIFLLVYA